MHGPALYQKGIGTLSFRCLSLMIGTSKNLENTITPMIAHATRIDGNDTEESAVDISVRHVNLPWVSES